MNNHLHAMLTTLSRASNGRSSSVVKSPGSLPQLDVFGNVIKAPLSPCDMGDSRYQRDQNGDCVPNPVRIKGGITQSVVTAKKAQPFTLPLCPNQVIVHVWKNTYAQQVYVLGPTHDEAKRMAVCVGKAINADGSNLASMAGGTYDSYWKGSGFHVILPVFWYEALKNIGVKGLVF